MRRQVRSVVGLRTVGRGVLGGQIAPSLVGPARLPNRKHEGGIENKGAPLAVRRMIERLNGDDPLANLTMSADDPIERAARNDLGRAPGTVARQVANLGRLASGRGEAAFPQAPKVGHIVNPDADLEKMDRHRNLEGDTGPWYLTLGGWARPYPPFSLLESAFRGPVW